MNEKAEWAFMADTKRDQTEIDSLRANWNEATAYADRLRIEKDAEIARLRAELVAALGYKIALLDELKIARFDLAAARQDAKRLRAALEQIASLKPEDCYHGDVDGRATHLPAVIASAALRTTVYRFECDMESCECANTGRDRFECGHLREIPAVVADDGEIAAPPSQDATDTKVTVKPSSRSTSGPSSPV